MKMKNAPSAQGLGWSGEGRREEMVCHAANGLQQVAVGQRKQLLLVTFERLRLDHQRAHGFRHIC